MHHLYKTTKHTLYHTPNPIQLPIPYLKPRCHLVDSVTYQLIPAKIIDLPDAAKSMSAHNYFRLELN